MDEEFIKFVFSVLAGVIGGGVAYWFGVRKQLQEIRGEYDQKLREERRDAYVELWKAFEPLAVYAPVADITYAGIAKLGVALRSWYFENGGLLMTDRARDTYFLVQDAIDRVDQLRKPRVAIRPKTRHWTRTGLDRKRVDLGLPPAPSAEAGVSPPISWRKRMARRMERRSAAVRWWWRFGPVPDAYRTWQERMKTEITRWPFGVAPEDDFVLLQFLASSLRTQLAEDLHTRSRSILDRG